MNDKEVLRVLEKTGALIADVTNDIVWIQNKNGMFHLHGTVCFNKDEIYPQVKIVSRLCHSIAKQFADDNVEVVIGPTVGGAILSQWTAHHLYEMCGCEVLSIYADKNRVLKSNSAGDYENIITIRKSFDNFVKNKRVLVVDDTLITGGSINKVIKAARDIGGNVIGLGVLLNQRGITPQDMDIPKLTALLNATLNTRDEYDYARRSQ